MSEFHDDFPSYETLAHHSEEEGKKKRRKLWNVFWIMLIVTLIELWVGFKAADWGIVGTAFLKVFFITLTIVKAGYIVMSFMHLGDEEKSFRNVILIPFCVFIIYLVALVDLSEGAYSKENRYGIDPNIIKQNLRTENSHSGNHHNGEKH
jgi:caa(3)-type oxidase subunit IV